MTTSAAPPLHIVMTADAVGGVWSYALDLAEALIDLGLRVTLVTIGPAPSADQRAEARKIEALELVHTGLPLDWTAKRWGEIEDGAAALATIARWARADLIHLNHPAFGVADFHAPVVAMAHSCVATWWQAVRQGPMPSDFLWRSELARRGYRRAAAVMAPSAAFAHATASIHGLSRIPIVVRNGRPAARRTARRLRSSSPFAFTAGRLWDEGKNVGALDRAAARLAHPVFAAGPTQGPNGAAARIEHMRPLGALSFSDVDQWLRRATVFVSTARYEPFGLSVLEAAQRGCALVLSDIPSFRELWSDAAEFAPPDDDKAIAEALERVLRDQDTARRRGGAAHARAQRYAVATMASATCEVYQALTARRLRTRSSQDATEPEAAA